MQANIVSRSRIKRTREEPEGSSANNDKKSDGRHYVVEEEDMVALSVPTNGKTNYCTSWAVKTFKGKT